MFDAMKGTYGLWAYGRAKGTSSRMSGIHKTSKVVTLFELQQ